MPRPPRTFTAAQVLELRARIGNYPVPSPLKRGLDKYEPWTSHHRVHTAAYEYAKLRLDGQAPSICSICAAWCVSKQSIYGVLNSLSSTAGENK